MWRIPPSSASSSSATPAIPPTCTLFACRPASPGCRSGSSRSVNHQRVHARLQAQQQRVHARLPCQKPVNGPATSRVRVGAGLKPAPTATCASPGRRAANTSPARTSPPDPSAAPRAALAPHFLLRALLSFSALVLRRPHALACGRLEGEGGRLSPQETPTCP